MRTVFISNLAWDVDEAELVNFMRQAGKVERAQLIFQGGQFVGCACVARNASSSSPPSLPPPR